MPKGTNFSSKITSTLNGILTNNSGYVVFGECTGTPPTTASTFAHGCLLIQSDSGTGEKAIFENVGSTAVPSWDAVGSINATDIAAGAVTLAKLASGVAPSHIVKYAGTFTTAGGDASEAITVTGAAATDIVSVTVKTAGATPRSIVAATAATNAINVTLSGDPSTDHVLQYVVFRAAA